MLFNLLSVSAFTEFNLSYKWGVYIHIYINIYINMYATSIYRTNIYIYTHFATSRAYIYEIFHIYIRYIFPHLYSHSFN